MNKAKVIWILFLLMVLAQVWIPIKMVISEERILDKGVEYKFKLEPVDPIDPLRGKYLTLNFEADSYLNTNKIHFNKDEEVYVVFSENHKGFAQIENVQQYPPDQGRNYLHTTIRLISYTDDMIYVRLPFDRYYIEESKALAAEKLYRKLLSDSTSEMYSTVSLLNGEASLIDIQIKGVSIEDYLGELE